MVNFKLASGGSGTPARKPTQPINPIFKQPAAKGARTAHPPMLPQGSPAPAPQAAPQQQQSSGGGGISGFAAAAAPPVATPPAAPAPVKDIDWFNQDSVYRGAAGRSLADLTGQLAQILAQRDSNYQQLDHNRADLQTQRTDDLNDAGSDFASRGLAGSGLYADYADDIAADYSNQGAALDQTQQQLSQQYGNRGAMVNLKGLNNNNGMADLSGIYGLLGSLGLQAGGQYNQAIGKAKADSAARSTQPLLQTTSW
jgi:hypothetical protein